MTAYCPLCGNTSRHWDGCDNTAHTFDPGRLAAGKANPAQPLRDGHCCQEWAATNDLTIDHIMPITKGGTDELDNLRILCRPCNSRKKDRA